MFIRILIDIKKTWKFVAGKFGLPLSRTWQSKMPLDVGLSEELGGHPEEALAGDGVGHLRAWPETWILRLTAGFDLRQGGLCKVSTCVNCMRLRFQSNYGGLSQPN